MDRSTILALGFIAVPFVTAALGPVHRPYDRRLLDHVIFFCIGVNGVVAGLSAPFNDAAVMNLSFGMLGLAAPWSGRGWKRATAFGYGFFLATSAWVQAYDAVVFGRQASWTDAIAPLLLVALFARGADHPHPAHPHPAI